MRATPAYLMLISFLLTASLFAQDHISETNDSIVKNNEHPTITYNSHHTKKGLTSYTKSIEIKETGKAINKSKNADTKTKAVIESTEKIPTSVPRTTIDFF